ncbi:MAG: hypothetical protein NT022_00825 [Deltaproteobacteria bacterium]|nr:hypothetical protein [Deltaproteobacteria bacterium]
MAKLKKGDALTCEVCGLVVVVDESCGCAVGEIICCKTKPMAKGKAVADKAKKKKAAAKASARSAAAKKVVKAKPAVKKAGKKPAAKAKKK